MDKATMEITRQALMNLYICFPLLFGSSSSFMFLAEKAIRFLTEATSHERHEMTLWALRRRNHENCLGLMDLRLSGNEDGSEPLISSKEKLSGFSIVTATEFGAMNEEETESIEKNKEEKLEYLVLWNVCHYKDEETEKNMSRHCFIKVSIKTGSFVYVLQTKQWSDQIRIWDTLVQLCNWNLWLKEREREGRGSCAEVNN